MKINISTELCSVTDIGLVREQNEDNCSVVATPNGTLCVVCDGMGGHAGGEKASQIAVDCIVHFLTLEQYEDIPQALHNALDFANMQILGKAAEHLELRGMGSTACILLIQDSQAWIAHVGDSRIYLYVAAKKRLHLLTKDHSYVQWLVDQGIIYPEEADSHPDKNRILKALGIMEELKPEVAENPILPAKGDIFLLCSDGVSGMVSKSKMEQILADKTELNEKEAALLLAAKEAGGTDNITFQLASITRSPHRKSIFIDTETVQPKGERVKRRRFGRVIIPVLLAIVTFLAGIWIGNMYGRREGVPKSSAQKEVQPSGDPQIAKEEQTQEDIQIQKEALTSEETAPETDTSAVRVPSLDTEEKKVN